MIKYFNFFFFFVKTQVILSGNFSLNEKIMENFKTLYSSGYCENGKNLPHVYNSSYDALFKKRSDHL